MTDKQIGNLVKEIRKEKRIRRRALAYGLCGEATLAHFEKGERKLDNLLVQRIFDCIGIEADEFAFMVTEEEYAYFLWKEDVFQAMEQQDWDELEAEKYQNDKIAIEFLRKWSKMKTIANVRRKCNGYN